MNTAVGAAPGRPAASAAVDPEKAKRKIFEKPAIGQSRGDGPNSRLRLAR